jgi:glycosyltransferase involved in cell wall biosynthesis
LHVNDVANVGANLVEGLRELGVEADLFPITTGTRLGRFKAVALPLIKVQETLALRRLVRRQKFDIVHVHYAVHASMTLAMGIPYFLHLHGSDVRSGLRSLGLRELVLLAIRKAVKVFYVTPDLKVYLKDIRPDAIFLPNPINTDMFLPAPSEESLLRVFCISKPEPFKGVGVFLRGIELAWEIRPQMQVALFGFGDSKIAQSFIEKHRGQPRLIILPRVLHAEMPALVRSFDVILGQHSPDVGALGVSELEAMACEKPIVCYFNYPETYPEPPPVLVSRTPEEACAHMLRLLDDAELRRSLGQQARAWVLKYHGRRHVAQLLLEHYRQD